MRATPWPLIPRLLPVTSRSPFARRQHAGPLILVVCFLLVATLPACRDQRIVSRPSEPMQECRVLQDDEYKVPLATPSTAPTSHLAVWLFATETWLNEQLDEEQPRRLARESARSIGAPGRASYEVTRGAVRLGQRGSQILLSMPVSADITVCKPIGRSCLRYGECEPQFRVEAALESSLSDEYGWPPPELSLRTERRCVIGLDVTPRLREVAERELRAVHRSVVSSWPDPRTWAARGIQASSQPAIVGSGSCIRWLNPAFRQRALMVREVLEQTENSAPMVPTKELSFGLELSGHLVSKGDCARERQSTEQDDDVELPQLETLPNLRRSSLLYLPERLEVEGLHAAAASQLPADGPVTIREFRTFEGGLAAQLQLKETFCGTLWVQGKLSADAGQLAWTSLEPASAAAFSGLTETERAALEETLALVSARVSWPLPLDAWARSAEAQNWLDTQLAPLRGEVEARGGQLLVKGWKVGKPRVDADPKAVLVSTPLRAAVSLERASEE